LKITKVWKVINEWDPLKKMDECEIDEYKHEINRIASVYKDSENTKELAEAIYDIFSKSYNEEFDQSVEECIEVAEKLLKFEE
jgi:deoxyhypusine synthase